MVCSCVFRTHSIRSVQVSFHTQCSDLIPYAVLRSHSIHSVSHSIPVFSIHSKLCTVCAPGTNTSLCAHTRKETPQPTSCHCLAHSFANRYLLPSQNCMHELLPSNPPNTYTLRMISIIRFLIKQSCSSKAANSFHNFAVS